jgi:hypothetical protein
MTAPAQQTSPTTVITFKTIGLDWDTETTGGPKSATS